MAQQKESRLNAPPEKQVKINERQRKLYAKNRSENARKNRASAAIYRDMNRERVNEYHRNYQANKRLNDPEYRKRKSAESCAYTALRENTDPVFKAERRMKALLRVTMVKWGGRKAARSEALLGCTVEQARKHLESQFLPGMTWENHGVHGWHIDHIRPCASFEDLSDLEQQKQCCHWTNLQPLWAEDNRAKSDKWEQELQAA